MNKIQSHSSDEIIQTILTSQFKKNSEPSKCSIIDKH